jgi:hypothetical protein
VALGRMMITAAAMAQLDPTEVLACLRRHVRGDWGDLDADDRKSNERALRHGGRVLSAYTTTQGQRFWIITEWDQSLTTVLLPEDY